MDLTLCFHLDLHGLNDSDLSVLNKSYQGGMKKLLKYLYSHPNFRLAVSLPAPVILHYSRKYPEAIEILRDLISRSQIELLGGGYYSPIFPLLFPIDRTGQIEKMTSLLRNAIGKRPRGLSLFGGIWEPSVIPSLESCGMEYVLLESSLIPHPEMTFMPMISSEQGKCIKILAQHKDLFPNPDEDLNSWLGRIEKKYIDSSKSSETSLEKKCLCVSGGIKQFMELFENKDFSGALESSEEICLSTPFSIFESALEFADVYIPGGMDSKLSKNSPTVYDFFRLFPQDKQLYKRMMYISMLISQSHGGDKMRKKAAQEKVWEAQAGSNFIDLESGLPSHPSNQQAAYRILNQAEQYIRESGTFVDSVTSFDYDNNGLKEFVCQMQNYNSVISLKGGMITDLNVFPSGPNYAAGRNFFALADGKNSCPSGIFKERLVEQPLAEKDVPTEAPLDFSSLVFSKKKFDARRKEIQMEVLGKFSSLALPVLLTKNYRIFSNGFTVQYILANRSPFPLKGTFIVELNLAQTDFSVDNQYEIELIQDENRNKADGGKFAADSGISLIQVTDESEKRLFLVEPNEAAGLITENVSAEFRDENGAGFPEKSRTMQFYWPVDLAAGLSMEKSLTLSLMPLKNPKKH